MGVNRMMTLWTLGSVMVNTLARTARDLGSVPGVGTIFHILITPMTLVPGPGSW